MKSIKSKYKLCQDNSFQELSNNTTIVGHPGHIWVPYILIDNPITIISEGNIRYWERIRQIKLRRQKIEGIINKINEKNI